MSNGACGTPAGSNCPTGTASSFDSDTGGFDSTNASLSNVRWTCERSYCGPGALVMDGRLQNPGNNLGQIARTLPQATNLVGKTLTAYVYVDALTASTRAHVQTVGTGNQYVTTGETQLAPGWNVVSGPVTDRSAMATTKITVEVYLGVAGQSWTGRIFVDEVGWR
jgi:hypothetical protein